MVNEAKFWQDMPEIQQQLNQIDPIIQDNLASDKGELGDALRYAFSASGKKLRPAFVLEFGQLQKPAKNDKLLKIATSVEVLHNATLMISLMSRLIVMVVSLSKQNTANKLLFMLVIFSLPYPYACSVITLLKLLICALTVVRCKIF